MRSLENTPGLSSPLKVTRSVSGTLNQSLPEAIAAAPSVEPTPVEKTFSAPYVQVCESQPTIRSPGHDVPLLGDELVAHAAADVVDLHAGLLAEVAHDRVQRAHALERARRRVVDDERDALGVEHAGPRPCARARGWRAARCRPVPSRSRRRRRRCRPRARPYPSVPRRSSRRSSCRESRSPFLRTEFVRRFSRRHRTRSAVRRARSGPSANSDCTTGDADRQRVTAPYALRTVQHACTEPRPSKSRGIVRAVMSRATSPLADEPLHVHLEAALVRREDERAAAREEPARRGDDPDVIALHVEGRRPCAWSSRTSAGRGRSGRSAPRRPRGESSHASTSSRTRTCAGPPNPLSSMLRAAHSRYAVDMSTLVVASAPPAARTRSRCPCSRRG